MPKRDVNNLTTAVLIDLIQSVEPHYKANNRSKIQLLLKASSLGLVSDAQFEASKVEKHTTVKCYFYTLTEDPAIQNAVEDCVLTYSVLWWRCKVLLNLSVHEMMNIPFPSPGDVHPSSLPWNRRTRNVNEEALKTLHDSVRKGDTPTFLRHLFLPEMWEDSKLEPIITACLRKHDRLLTHLSPTGWEDLMARTGWHQLANEAAKMLKTNIQITIQRRVSRAMRLYVKHWVGEEDSKKVYTLLSQPQSITKPKNFPIHIIQHVKELRTMLGLKKEERLGQFPTFSLDMMHFYLHIYRAGLIKGSIMPLGSLSRVHTYFDNNVLKSLLPSHFDLFQKEAGGGTFMAYLGFSVHRFVEKQNLKRKNLKKRARTAWRHRRTNKRKKQGRGQKRRRKKREGNVRDGIHKKWAHRGGFSLPKNSEIRSFRSDGVGISLNIAYKSTNLPPYYETPYQKPSKEEMKRREEERFRKMREEDEKNGLLPSFIGIDEGRAKLYFGACSHPHSETPSHHVFTRPFYLYKTAFKRRQRCREERLKSNIALTEAYQNLDEAAASSGFVGYLAAHTTHFEVIWNETVKEKDAAFEKMNFYRHKQSCLAKAANQLLNAGMQRKGRLVIGVGNASFPSGGRGEISVPVKAMAEALEQAKRQKESANARHACGPIEFVKINEFRTSKCCWKCDAVCSEPRVSKKKRGCRTGSQTAAGKRRKTQTESRSEEHADGEEEGTRDVSTRLKYCPNCQTTVDRDQQGAYNILELTKLKYEGKPRPPHLTRDS